MILITCLITLLPLFFGLVMWNQLPDPLATSFNFQGEAQGWSGKTFTVIGLPLLLLAVHLLCAFMVAVDPKRKNINGKIYLLCLWICPVVSLFCALIIYGNALNCPLNITRLTMVFVGGVFLGIGNYLPKTHQNYTVGFKLPWTLEDEENWNRTHRLAGQVWVFGGTLTIVNAFLGNMWIFIAAIVLMVLIPTVYSYWLYTQKHGKNEEK
jgi:uncharacterized membrane protein